MTHTLPSLPLFLIGRREFISFPLLGIDSIEAKIDTGAYTSSIHCDSIEVKQVDGKLILHFKIDPFAKEEFKFEEFKRKKIKNSFGEMEERFIIKTLIILGNKKIRSSISLTNRDHMRYPVLIGRRILKGRFLIDVSKLHINNLN